MRRVVMKMKVVGTWTGKLSLDSRFRFLFQILSLFRFDSVALLLFFLFLLQGGGSLCWRLLLEIEWSCRR